MQRNPYIAGNPIQDNAAFFGREDVFREVIKLLRHPEENSIVLYGQRRIGKTSVLMQLDGRLAQEEGNPFCPVYFDLQDKAALPLAELLYGLALQITALTGQPPPDRQNFDPAGEFFQSNFLPAASQAAGKTIVLLFDEFDVLDSPLQEDAVQSPAIQSFFPYLRRWMAAVRNVKFVFVIGRRPEDLSIKTNAMFKATRTARISLLSKSAAVEVISQSEREGSLTWDPQAIEAVWGWTHGHPYLTQLLCGVLWENAVFGPEQAGSHLLAADVEQAVPAATEQGDHAFHWIWDGLPPAEKTVIAAMAEAPGEAFTQENLIELLNQSGVRLILRELELAPETLARWEVLYKEGDTYHFSVPLLRRWVAKRHPLNRVKEELDRLDPTADALYQSGLGYSQASDLDEATSQLKRALDFNPNHLKSRLLLGRIAFEQKRLDDAVIVLEEAFRYDPVTARAELIKTLLARATEQVGDAQISTYERVLQISPNQPVAQQRLALHFQVTQAQKAIEFEGREQWDNAIRIYEDILARYPDTPEVAARLQATQTQARLAQAYREALGALQSGNPAVAKPLLGGILGQDPDYKDTAQLLVRAQNEEREAKQKAGGASKTGVAVPKWKSETYAKWERRIAWLLSHE